MFLDEGSSQYALMWWLSYHIGLRFIPIRDVYHREWNDCKNAIMKAGLSWVIQATNLLYNLAYGPWEGCAWFNELVEGAALLLERCDMLALSTTYGEAPHAAPIHQRSSNMRPPRQLQCWSPLFGSCMGKGRAVQDLHHTRPQIPGP